MQSSARRVRLPRACVPGARAQQQLGLVCVHIAVSTLQLRPLAA